MSPHSSSNSVWYQPPADVAALDLPTAQRAERLFRTHRQSVFRHTDRMFAVLLFVQWLGGIGAALWITPYTWIGTAYHVHVHVLAAVFLGAAIVSLPIALALVRPGATLTRHVIAVAQMLYSALLIHLTGGRIETHFHVFGSLAFLAFYRDWRVLVTASLVVMIDHLVRGVWWPQSVFGVASAGQWRWMEHTAWVAFEDLFLIGACRRGTDEMHAIAWRQAEVESAHAQTEDLVARRTAELQRAKAAAEDATLAKSEFLANMSHEIRTPMTAILGYTELLAHANEDPHAPPPKECIDVIRRNGRHLLNLINDILDLSKIEAGKMVVEHTEVDPTHIVHDALSLMHVKAKDKGLSLVAEYETAVPARIRTDPTRLRQILVNLVGNAVKFTETGGIVLTVRLEVSPSGEGTLHFEVTDSGIGIEPHQAARLFRAFEQGDASMMRRFGGTGLGLRISRRLAEIMGGDITLVSHPGEGSTFTLSIPTGPLEGVPLIEPSQASRCVRETPPAASTPEPPPRLDGVRVLLAEDGPDNQRLIAFHLRQAGAEVTIAENGSRVLEWLADGGPDQHSAPQPAPFDLVLMDMQMPEVDGYTATTCLRARNCKLPIIALTAHAMSGSREKCLEAGCDDFATKPIDKEKLIALCARLAIRREAGATR